LVHKILTFYINGVLNCKCLSPGLQDFYVCASVDVLIK